MVGIARPAYCTCPTNTLMIFTSEKQGFNILEEGELLTQKGFIEDNLNSEEDLERIFMQN